MKKLRGNRQQSSVFNVESPSITFADILRDSLEKRSSISRRRFNEQQNILFAFHGTVLSKDLPTISKNLQYLPRFATSWKIDMTAEANLFDFSPTVKWSTSALPLHRTFDILLTVTKLIFHDVPQSGMIPSFPSGAQNEQGGETCYGIKERNGAQIHQPLCPTS